MVLHNCDNPPCMNPSHWRLGTHLDNMADRRVRGGYRQPRSVGGQYRESDHDRPSGRFVKGADDAVQQAILEG
jgi:hypothetical protein